MTVRLLERLKDDAFRVSVGFLLPPPLLRRSLLGSRDVQRIQEALRSGALTHETIRRFTASLIAEFKRGERFAYDLAVAALAVVLERSPTEFAEEFLYDLSRLQLAEMSISTQIARECLRERTALPRNLCRSFAYGREAGDRRFFISLESSTRIDLAEPPDESYNYAEFRL